MKLNEDMLPSNLDEAVLLLVAALEPDEMEEAMRSAMNKFDGEHHFLGRALRNKWNFWEDSPIVRWFIATHRICHADDISGIVLEAFAAKLNGEPYDPAPTVEKYHKHWRETANMTPEQMIAEWKESKNNPA